MVNGFIIGSLGLGWRLAKLLAICANLAKILRQPVADSLSLRSAQIIPLRVNSAEFCKELWFGGTQC